MKIIRLIRTHFDSLENRNPKYDEHVATFAEDEKRTAHGVCADWIRENLKNESMYLGYDGEVYPKYRIEYENIKSKLI